MDRYTPPFLGRRRGWLVMTQVLLLLAIAAMGFLEPSTQLRWMAALAVVIAFCSASQDIVLTHGRRTSCQQKSVAPVRQSACLATARVCWFPAGWPSGLPTAISAGRGMYWLMAALLIPCIIATLFAPEPSDVIPVPARWSRPSPHRSAISLVAIMHG